ncbi:unnamed protein product, partial [Polarella glacialis]
MAHAPPRACPPTQTRPQAAVIRAAPPGQRNSRSRERPARVAGLGCFLVLWAVGGQVAFLACSRPVTSAGLRAGHVAVAASNGDRELEAEELLRLARAELELAEAKAAAARAKAELAAAQRAATQ